MLRHDHACQTDRWGELVAVPARATSTSATGPTSSPSMLETFFLGQLD